MPVQETKVNPHLLLDFFLTFSRFEYSLKTSGFFIRPSQHGNQNVAIIDAKPDWKGFADSIRELFQSNINEELKAACEYLFINPPMKQVVDNSSIYWQPISRNETDWGVKRFLEMVRIVRNNLFHGGKHSNEVYEETERTARLLNSSLIVLRECLQLSPTVKLVFDSARI